MKFADELLKLAEMGSVKAQIELAHQYELGRIEDLGLDAALFWYERAASNGDKSAIWRAGDVCKKLGRNAEMVRWYKLAAEGDDVEGEWRLGVLYEEGCGVDKDLAKAKELYEKACSHTEVFHDGDIESEVRPVSRMATWRLGRFIDLGLSGERDIERVEKLYCRVCGILGDELRGEEDDWGEFFFRYAELVNAKHGKMWTALSYYAKAACARYPGAKESYVRAWLSYRDSDGDRAALASGGMDWIREVADAGGRDEIAYLAGSEPRYAWKLYRLGEKKALQQLISYYSNVDLSRKLVGLKGRRLCALLCDLEAKKRSVLEAAKTKQEMISTFRLAIEGGDGCGEASFKIYQWERQGLLSYGVKYRHQEWLECAAQAKYQPGIEETRRLAEEKEKELELAYQEEKANALAGKQCGWKIDEKFYPRLVTEVESLATSGDVSASKLMARIYQDGWYGKRRDAALELKWRICAAKAGDAESMKLLFKADEALIKTICKTETLPYNKLELTKALAEIGDEDAILRYASILTSGAGCNKNPELAVEYYQRVQNRVEAKRGLVALYSQGYGGSECKKKIRDLELGILVSTPVDSKAAASKVISVALDALVNVEEWALPIGAAVKRGSPLNEPYSVWGSSREDVRDVETDIDLSMFFGPITRLLVDLFARQGEDVVCKDKLCRIYSLSSKPNIASYRKFLDDYNVACDNQGSICERLVKARDAKAGLTRPRFLAMLNSNGINALFFERLLYVLSRTGLVLREPFVFDHDEQLLPVVELGEDAVEGHIRWGVEKVLDFEKKSREFSQFDNEADPLEGDTGESAATKLDSLRMYWLGRCSERGDARASYLCGRLYLMENCTQSAERFLKLGEEQGSAECAMWLGKLYSSAEDGAVCTSLAAVCFRKAFDKGEVEAAEGLGDVCLRLYLCDVSKFTFSINDRKEYPSVDWRTVLEAFSIKGVTVTDANSCLQVARTWYQTGMDKGATGCLFKFGLMLVQGLGGEMEEGCGLAHIRSAAWAGCVSAAEYIAVRKWCLPSGDPMEREEIWQFLKLAHKLGSSRTKSMIEQYRKGFVRPRILDEDDYSILKDWPMGWGNSFVHSCAMLSENFDVVKEIADRGSAVAQFKVGCKLYNGYVDHGYYGDYASEVRYGDKNEAAGFFRRAASAGYIPALTILGVIAEKQDGFQTGPSRGREYYERASRLGDGYAGWKLYKERVSKFEEGKVTFPEVSNSSAPIDVWSVGYCLENGIGVRVNRRKAGECYCRAAALGFTPGIVSYGKCLMEGIGIARDGRRAYAWFLEAACRGDVGGIYFLGLCYANACGCEADLRTAFALFAEAARHGNGSAKLEAAKILVRNQMTAKQFGKCWNAVTAETLTLPDQYFSVFSRKSRKLDLEKALQGLADTGSKEAGALLAELKIVEAGADNDQREAVEDDL